MPKKQGWEREPGRHALASKGVKTRCKKLKSHGRYPLSTHKPRLRAYSDHQSGMGDERTYVVAKAGVGKLVGHLMQDTDEWSSESSAVAEPNYPDLWDEHLLKLLKKNGIDAIIYHYRGELPEDIKEEDVPGGAGTSW